MVIATDSKSTSLDWYFTLPGNKQRQTIQNTKVLVLYFYIKKKKPPLNQDKTSPTKQSEKLATEARIWGKDKKRDFCRIILEESEPQIA